MTALEEQVPTYYSQKIISVLNLFIEEHAKHTNKVCDGLGEELEKIEQLRKDQVERSELIKQKILEKRYESELITSEFELKLQKLQEELSQNPITRT